MLPHIQNSTAGRNLYDPVHSNMFEVYFTLPEALRAEFAQDEALITEHVQSISGLEALQRTPATIKQKFMGTERTFIAPKVDSTSAEIEVKLSLNLRNGVDNYIYKLFRSWGNLCYDMQTGSTLLKKDYVADYVKIVIANRANDIYHEIVFKDVMLAGISDGLGELSYDTNDPVGLTVKFASDWWKETIS